MRSHFPPSSLSSACASRNRLLDALGCVLQAVQIVRKPEQQGSAMLREQAAAGGTARQLAFGGGDGCQQSQMSFTLYIAPYYNDGLSGHRKRDRLFEPELEQRLARHRNLLPFRGGRDGRPGSRAGG
jgi:hypothetical protein